MSILKGPMIYFFEEFKGNFKPDSFIEPPVKSIRKLGSNVTFLPARKHFLADSNYKRDNFVYLHLDNKEMNKVWFCPLI